MALRLPSIKSSKFFTFFSAPILLWVVAGLAAATITVFFRLYPLTVYPQYAAKSKAELLIYTNVQRTNALHQQDFKKFLSDQKIKLDAAIEKTAQDILSKERLKKTPPYLMEVDPYYYLGLTRHLVAAGSLPATPSGRNYLNPHTLAPEGAWYPLDYHAYAGASLYWLVSKFSPSIDLMQVVAWVPLILAILCMIPFFLITKKIFSINPASFFLAATTLSLCPIFLRRSLWGWYDTDGYNVFFPLLILYFLFCSLSISGKIIKNRFLWAAGLSGGLYSLFWRGWLLSYTLIGVAFFVCVLLNTPGNIKKKANHALITVSLYIGIPFLFTLFFWGPNGLIELVGEAKQAVSGFYKPTFSLWPDVFLTVGELRHASATSLLKLLGGPLPILLFVLGIFSSLMNKSRENMFTRQSATLALFLFLLTLIPATGIERFSLLLVAPLSIGVALGIQRIYSWLERSKFISPTSLKTTFTAVLLYSFLWQGHLTARYEHPIYNKTWDRAMSFLREKTPKESIVTSWWSPGHFITSMGDRRVTFDGSTQNTPQAYWVANFFLEASEEKALSILHMLNSSGNKAVDFLTEKKYLLSEAVTLIHHILTMDKSVAQKELEKSMPPADAQKLASLTHGDRTPPPAYLFIYNDMVEQALALEYIGEWDFARAEAFRTRLAENPEQFPKKVLSRSSKEYARLIWSLARGPYAQDTESYQIKQVGSFIYFANGLTLDLVPMEASLSSIKYGIGILSSVYFIKNGHFEKKASDKSSLNIAALILEDVKINALGQKKSLYQSVLADPKLIESLLFRLYYLKGEGLKHFKLVASEENAETRTRLYVFEVLWD